MRNAARILIVLCGTVAFAGCGKKSPQASEQNEAMSPDSSIAAGQIPANADIETLPPDESSEASNAELSTGDDNPDVNNLGNSH